MTPEQLKQLMDAIVSLMSAVLLACTPFVAAWAAGQLRDVLARNNLLAFARVAVLAAEQLGATKQIQDKKIYAVQWLTDALTARGLQVPVAEIEAAIEAAVYAELKSAPLLISAETLKE